VEDEEDTPIDDSNGLSIGTITVRENFVINANILESFDYRQWCTRENGLHHS
jgi:hypothetical protein